MQKIFRGKFTSAAGAAEVITLGCKPCYIKIVNVTTDDDFEVFDIGGVDMMTTTDGTTSTAADIIVRTETSTIVASASGFTVPAALLTTDDVVYWVAFRDEG